MLIWGVLAKAFDDLQKNLGLFIPTQLAAGIFPSMQRCLEPFTSYLNKIETSQSFKGQLGSLSPAQAALEISPSTFVPLGPLPGYPEPLVL